MDYRVLTPEEALPLLLDAKLSPVVACDTEYRTDDEIWPGRLRGASMAGGTPEAGFFGCFWSFEEPYQRIPYPQFAEQALYPIVGDPDRIFTCHPLNIEMPQFRARGLTDDMTRCTLEDTIAMAYIYDDNLPHALKELAYCVLLKHGATTYAQTNKILDTIRKQGGKVSKQIIELVWQTYKEERKKSKDLEAEIDPTWPGWRQLAMSLPPGMVRSTPKSWACGGKKGCGAKNLIDPEALGLGMDCISLRADCLSCGRKRKLTHGVEQHVKPIIRPVVQADYDQRAQDRFEIYGAEDAIFTLMLRYQFEPTFTPLQREHLELETKITHPIVVRMQERGLKIDIPLLESIHWSMSVALENLRADVVQRWSLPGDETALPNGVFNPASNDQLAKRIWLDWKLNPPKWAKERGGGIKKKYQRAKDGLCKADGLILETVEKAYRGTPYGIAIKRLLDLRRWEKLFNTYVDAILTMARRDPDGRIHSTFWPTGARSGRFCVAKGTPIEVLRDVSNYPKGVPIEDVEPGDYAYTYDAGRRLTLRRVTWAGATGTRQVVRINWRGQGNKHVGYLDVTGNHEVRLVSGKYVCADQLVPGDRVLALSRGVHSRYGYARVWAANEREIAREHRWVYENLHGPLTREKHVHHKDANKLNNHPDNLEEKDGKLHISEHARKYWEDPERRRQQSLRTSAQWADGKMTPSPSGAGNPNWKHLDPKWLESVLWAYGGKPTAFRDVYGLDYECVMRKVRAAGIDWKAIRFLHKRDGTFVTKEMVVHARTLPQSQAQRYVEKSYYGLRKLQEFYGLDPWNHVVESVELLPDEVPVYDIEVEETHNFIAGELCVHNSSMEPNVENIPRPFTMPTLEIEWALRMFAVHGFTDPSSPPPGFIATNKHGAKVKPGVEPTHWRVESLREIFIPAKGCVFVSADLSQIENRLTGYESRDRTLLNLYKQWDCFECKATGSCDTILHACPQCGCSDKEGKRDKRHPDQPVVKGFVHGKDIHSATAAALNYFEKYGPDDARQQAKPVNHASTYGMGPATFAKRNDIPVKQAEQDMALWHSTYPGIKGNLHARASSEALEHGIAKMFDGHERRFHAQRILKKSGNFRAYEWEGTIREYVNVLAQGGTGVIMKRAMISLDAAIREKALTDARYADVYLVNQVHDELLYECPESLAEELLALINYHLEHSAPEIDVPVLSEGGTGTTWGRAH